MIPSAFPTFEILVVAHMAAFLSRHLSDKHRSENNRKCSRLHLPTLMNRDINLRLAKGLGESGIVPTPELLCVELPYHADDIQQWANQPGVCGSEFDRVLENRVEFERRRIVINGLPTIFDMLQRNEPTDEMIAMLL